MTNVVLQGARAALPFIARTAGQVALAYGQTAISRLFDNRVFEGPRLESFHLLTSRDGAPMARVFGRVRLAGEVIWAAHIKETASEERVGGKGGGPRQRNYSYTMSFAIGLCAGEISGIGRIYAGGAVLQTDGLNIRVHKGGADQAPDPLIAEIEGGDVPAFKDTAYIVFEDFPLDDYGARLPQINVEIFRQPKKVDELPRLEEQIRAVNLIPGSGEYSLSPVIAEASLAPGVSQRLNINNLSGVPDVMAALDQLEAQLPHCKNVNIVVSWFGDDLRCGECQIKPGVETRERRVDAQPWRVCGLDRDNAELIRQVDGHAVYGGTPSDDSLILLIGELRRRGFKVGLYPFILMDVFGKDGQGEFPWRGRITVDGAPYTAQAEAQIAQFFGGATASDFSAANGEIIYSGPDEFGFNRHILHYAQLAQLAGGVDQFLIGTEMRGITTVPGTGRSYPAVSALQTLAGQVRQIVGPQTQISYAADWSEYFGHHVGDDVTFHLDPLWADTNIDAVAIDAYFPLSDWRDGEHMDASGSPGIHDRDYLATNVEGGEGYDWYYTSPEDRHAQIRTPISDGLAGKPWVYRYKDLRNWWSNPHYNRIGGVEQSTPTAWEAQSKPIWLTEIGCPAIDKGANQPNVFYDPKSSESAAPYFSSGMRDDLIQRRYLEAFLGHYSEDGAHNPMSSVYQGPMIAQDQMHVWCWDARPFPDFPARRSVWSDGENWQRGHWITGRVGAAFLPDIVAEITRDAGVAALDVAAISGLVQGYVIDRPMSARAALEPLFAAFDFTVVEGATALRFIHNGRGEKTELTYDDIVSAENGALVKLRDSPADLRRDVRLRFLDAGRDYALGSASVLGDPAETENISDIDLPLVLDAGQAERIARTLLSRANESSRQINFSLMPTRLGIEPGDRITLPNVDGVWQITQVQGKFSREISAVQMDAASEPLIGGDLPPEPLPVEGPSKPLVLCLDLPNFSDTERDGPLIGTFATPFAPLTVSTGASTAQLTQPMRAGKTLTALAAGPIARIDTVNSLEIELYAGQLASLSTADFLSGKNALALQTASGWEILHFETAELIGARRYRLSRFIRGVAGTDAFMDTICPTGSAIVILDDALQALTLSPEQIGEDISLLVTSASRSSETFGPFDYDAQHLRPLAPVHLRVRPDEQNLHLSWIRRTRLGGDSWLGTDVPLGEAEERYWIEILAGGQVVWSGESNAPSLSISRSELPGDTLLTIRIAQLSQAVGTGEFAQITFSF